MYYFGHKLTSPAVLLQIYHFGFPIISGYFGLFKIWNFPLYSRKLKWLNYPHPPDCGSFLDVICFQKMYRFVFLIRFCHLSKSQPVTLLRLRFCNVKIFLLKTLLIFIYVVWDIDLILLSGDKENGGDDDEQGNITLLVVWQSLYLKWISMATIYSRW